MSQSKFNTDSGFKVGDHFIQEMSNGNLTVSTTNQITDSHQKPLIVDHGLKIGDWQWFQDNDGALNVSTSGNTDASQFPFTIDAGSTMGAWSVYQTADGDLKLEQGDSPSPTPSATLSGGEGYATGWSSTQWISAADSPTGNPGVRINYHGPDFDSDWRTVLDNWQAGDQLIAKTPASVEDLTMTATGANISDDTSYSPWNSFFFDVTEEPPLGSVYLYLVEHTS